MSDDEEEGGLHKIKKSTSLFPLYDNLGQQQYSVESLPRHTDLQGIYSEL